MRIIYLPLFVLALFLSVSALSQTLRSPFLPEPSYMQVNNVKGMVKTLNTKENALEKKEGTTYDVYQLNHFIISFDKKGNPTQEDQFDGDSILLSKKVNHFDNQNRKIGQTFTLN